MHCNSSIIFSEAPDTISFSKEDKHNRKIKLHNKNINRP